MEIKLERVLCAFVLQCYLVLVRAHGSSLTFELPDNERFCISETFTGSSVYILQYKVIRGGQNDVDVALISPNGKILYKETKQKEGKHVFDTSNGQFQFCFSNEFSTFSHKIIYFDLKPEDQSNLAVEAGQAIPYVDTVIENSFNEIHTSMSTVVDFQRQYRLREAVGRFQAEVLHQRVLWWSFFQATIIMAAGVGQVFLVKKCFSKSKTTLLPTAEVVHANQEA